MKVSILIPTYNGQKFIKRLLGSLVEAKKPANFKWETIVIDNNSTDGIRCVVESFKVLMPELRYLFQAKPGKCEALNYGLLSCKGEFVAFLDHDVVVDSGYLTGLAEALTSPMCNVFGGRILALWETEPPGWLQTGKLSTNSYGGLIAHDYGEAPVQYSSDMRLPVGCNFFCRRSLFDHVGLFNVDLGPRPGLHLAGEESDILNRFVATGEAIYYFPAVTVSHPVDPKRATKSYFRYRLFCDGRAVCRMNGKKSKLPEVLGIPRYLFRTLLESMRDVLFQAVRGDKQRLFDSELEIFYTLGSIYESIRSRNQIDN